MPNYLGKMHMIRLNKFSTTATVFTCQQDKLIPVETSLEVFFFTLKSHVGFDC